MGHPTWVIALIIRTGTLTEIDRYPIRVKHYTTLTTVEGGAPKSF